MRSTLLSILFWSGAACSLSQAAIVSVGGSGQSASSLYFTPTLSGSPQTLGMSVATDQGALAVITVSGPIVATTYNTVGDVSFYSHSGTVFSRVSSAPTVDLATVGSGAWVGGAKGGVVAAVGDQFVFGWRWRPTGSTGAYHYGWTVIEYGSVTHIGSTANNTPGGGITFSAVPEPTAFSMVALSALGVAFARRRPRGV